MKITIEGTQEEIKQFMIDYAEKNMTLNIDELPKFSHEIPHYRWFTHDESLYKQHEQGAQK